MDSLNTRSAFLSNDVFKSNLQDTMQKMVDEVFTQEKVDSALYEVTERMKKLAISSYRRFNGNVTDTFFPSEIEKIKEFFDKFKGYLLTFLLGLLTIIEMCGGYINEMLGGVLTVNGIDLLPVITFLFQPSFF